MALAELMMKDLRHDLGRTVLGLFAALVVVISYLLLVSLSQALYDFSATANALPNLIVAAGDVVDPMQGQLGSELLQALEGLQGRGIQKISPVIFRFMRIEDQVYQLRAVPATDWTTVYGLHLVEGAWPTSNAQILLGEGVAETAGWRLGQNLRIYGSEFEVAGIVRAPGIKYMSLWISLEAGRQLFGDRRGYQLIVLQTRPGVNLDALQSTLEADLKAVGVYEVYLEDTLARQYTQAMQDVNQIMVLIVGVALLAISFGTYNQTALNLAEHRRELGLLRAIGFSPGALMAYVVNRALLVTGLAYLLGWAAAGLIISHTQAKTPIVISSAPVILRLTPVGITLGLGLALVFAALGAWLPTRRLLSCGVVDLIRT